VILGEDSTSIGQQKLDTLRDNCNYFRRELKRLGLIVIGDEDSPIIPVMVYLPAALTAFSRECLKRGLAVVVVGFPATSIIESRVRFCISAGHRREDLERAIRIIDEVMHLLSLPILH
jgi:serine palmitoyltransferase